MPSHVPAGERFTSRQKVEAVLRLIKGESADSLSTELGVSIRRLERWRSNYMAGGSAELAKRKSPVSQSWFEKQSGAILRWAGLIAALAASIALLALLLQRTV
jgi:hypothetical protein